MNKIMPRNYEGDLPMLQAIMRSYTDDRDPTGGFRIGIFPVVS
jgi:hypothetical protein